MSGIWKLGDRVARFDGSVGTVESIELAPFGGQNVHVKWDDPNATDEFNGVKDDDLISESDWVAEYGMDEIEPGQGRWDGAKAFCLCHPQIKFELVASGRVIVTQSDQFVRHLELAGRDPDVVIREWFELNDPPIRTFGEYA
jgi:hypothetical protein